jgi:hypothetical protein
MRTPGASQLLLAALLLAGCGGGPLSPPSPTGRPATLPGQPLLATVEWSAAAVDAVFTVPADGATPLRYELRCESATAPLTLSVDAALAVVGEGERRELRFELLPDDPVPARCALLAWSVRGYGLPSETVTVRPAPSPEPSPSPSGSPAPLATASFATGSLPTFDLAACLAPGAAPQLTAREPSSGSPISVSLAPGRFTTARLRDGTLLAAPTPLGALTPPLTTPSLRLRAGDRLELRVSGGLLAAATVELYEADVFVDGTLLLDPLRRRFSATGPGSVTPAVDPGGASATISLTLDPALPAGRYLLLVSGTAYSSCAAYTPERSVLLVEAVGGFAPPTAPPSPTLLP